MFCCTFLSPCAIDVLIYYVYYIYAQIDGAGDVRQPVCGATVERVCAGSDLQISAQCRHLAQELERNDSQTGTDQIGAFARTQV